MNLSQLTMNQMLIMDQKKLKFQKSFQQTIDETETPIEEETEAPIKAEAETSDEKPAEEAPEDVPEKAPVKGSEKVIAVDLNPPVKDSIEQELEDKPKMLSRYQENKLYANQALNNVQVANPNKVINLGAGLVLTEAQIFALAAQRVAPVLKSVEDHANVLRKNDEDKAKAIYNAFVTKDQGKLNKDLAKFKSGVDAENKKIVDSYDIRIGAHNKTMAENAAACEAYIASVATQMETDKDEAAKAEEKSAADHITNKENLATKLLTYKEDKEQELVDTKAKQEEEKKLAEEFKISGDDFKEKADALEIQLAEKEKELSEKLAYLDSLISEKGEHNGLIMDAKVSKNTNERDLKYATARHEKIKNNVDKLNAHILVLGTSLNKHTGNLTHLNTTGKEEKEVRLSEAHKAREDWDAEQEQMRIEAYKEQERIRIAAEEERKRVEQEKAEEEARLAKEKEEEEARIAKEKEEEEARLAKEKEEEEARLAREKEEKAAKEAKLKKEREEEHERLQSELVELEKIKKLKQEKARLQKELDDSNKSSGLGKGLIGGAIGAVTGAAVAGSAVAASTASGVANAGSSLVGKASDTVASTPGALSKSVNTPDLASPTTEGHPPESFPSPTRDVSAPIIEEDEPHVAGQVPEVSSPTPIRRRASMVDDALKYLTPEEVARMNTPVSEQIKQYQSKSRSNIYLEEDHLFLKRKHLLRKLNLKLKPQLLKRPNLLLNQMTLRN
ncbi:unnamed protein product [[Candida] boidinii]|nr:unnamed protein product [[Candida] boidinii]